MQLFRDAIKAALAYKSNPTDFTDQILSELAVSLQNFLFTKHQIDKIET